MEQTGLTEARALAAPTFYLTARQRVGPGPILLATVAAAGALCSVMLALGHNRRPMMTQDGTGAARSASSSAGAPDEDKDDPDQIDTIVLGDPSDAPVPARRGNHVSSVHPTILVKLPRFGEQVGLIPDTPAGRLLYAWLAAFNQTNGAALRDTLPGAAADAQMELRAQTGGYSLVSAKEVQPGVLVFRLRDQTPLAHEVLGTLQMRADSNPPAIANFSLRAVPSPKRDAASGR